MEVKKLKANKMKAMDMMISDSREPWMMTGHLSGQKSEFKRTSWEE